MVSRYYFVYPKSRQMRRASQESSRYLQSIPPGIVIENPMIYSYKIFIFSKNFYHFTFSKKS